MCVSAGLLCYLSLLMPSLRAAIQRDLASGITIIVDRYAFSGIAFSAAKVRSVRPTLGMQVTSFARDFHSPSVWAQTKAYPSLT